MMNAPLVDRSRTIPGTGVKGTAYLGASLPSTLRHVTFGMAQPALERLVSRRVGLAFESDKEHRTAVYVVFRLTDRLEVLSTLTAFPKCCCGGEFCI